MKAKFSEKQGGTFQTLGEDRGCELTKLICRIALIGFALLEVWSQWRFVNEDGVSYLDMSDVLIKHNWHLLVNPIWSPLYPSFIGVLTWLTRPPGQWEAPLVHAMNFLVFLGVLACFEFLMRQVINVLGRENGGADSGWAQHLPLWTWLLLGYGLFAWTTVGMIEAPKMITPDLCVAAFVYLDAGLLLRLRNSASSLRICMLLGLTLGFGYLAKAILFPMAFLFMLIAFFVIGEWRKAVLPVTMTFLIFCMIAAPLLVSMSERVGRPSYSESGNMNYVWHVNGFDPYAASAAVSGPPAYLKHPMTILHRRPDVYAFREPIAYTYPPRQDMEWWSAGASVVFTPRDQFRAIAQNLHVLFRDVHIFPMWCLIAAGLIFLLISPNASWRWKKALRSWPLFVPGIAGPVLYLLISVEPRYVAPFLVIVLLGLLPGIFLQNGKEAARRIVISTVLITTSAMVLTALLVSYHLAGLPHEDKGDLWVQVGTSLNAAGVQPGTDVAIIGDSSDGCRWARLARVRIVAQILREDVAGFWRIDPRVQADVYDAFARAGAKAVVAGKTTPSAGSGEWQRLGNTNYYLLFLTPSSSKGLQAEFTAGHSN